MQLTDLISFFWSLSIVWFFLIKHSKNRWFPCLKREAELVSEKSWFTKNYAMDKVSPTPPKKKIISPTLIFDIYGSIHFGNKSFIEIPTICILFIYLFICRLYMFRATPIFRNFKCTLQTRGVCTLWITKWILLGCVELCEFMFMCFLVYCGVAGVCVDWICFGGVWFFWT